MTKKGVAEWVSIILCLLPSPFVIMFLLIVAGEIREAWHITNFLAVTLCAIVGLIALLFTSWVLGKLVYFIRIKLLFLITSFFIYTKGRDVLLKDLLSFQMNESIL